MKIFRKSQILLFFSILCSTTLAADCCSSETPGDSNFTNTPIKHLIVIFQENRAFDHYFGTYPHAENKPGDTPFYPRKKTPTVNGLTHALRTINQNLLQPFRLEPSEANTCNPTHTYTSLQVAMDCGLMDKFVEANTSLCPLPGIVMGYFDGNTVTALWNYAQFFSLNDNYHGTNISASTVGAINLVSGQVHGAIPEELTFENRPTVIQGTLINDIDPTFDICSKTAETVKLTGRNVGNLLNEAHVTWGWFQGGFANCSATHLGPNGPVVDYVPHHNPFQYYRSTSNPDHLPPISPKKVGKSDQANHLYDLSDFWAAANVGNVPAVNFFKAPAYQNGHPGNSDPLLEQEFLVTTINRLQELPQWKNMAIIIAYDDSGGWYDHEMPPIINQSQISADALTGPGSAGSNPPLGGYQGRPGYGMRLPFILISPWAKENFVDSTLIDQTSILRFIEDNWDLGRVGDFSFDEFSGPLHQMFNFKDKPRCCRLILDPHTGQVVKQP